MLPCVCSVIDHRRRENKVRISMAHSAIASCATFLFLTHFDVISDLLLSRRLATWNLFVTEKTLNCRWVSNFPSFFCLSLISIICGISDSVKSLASADWVINQQLAFLIVLLLKLLQLPFVQFEESQSFFSNIIAFSMKLLLIFNE